SCAQSWEQIVLAEVASWLLSTLAGAMITTAGVVFSLTVVSLRLASGQFSPRVMRSFVRDRLSQVVIGLLVATFVFCVLTLRHVSADPAEPAPAITLTLAVVLAVVRAAARAGQRGATVAGGRRAGRPRARTPLGARPRGVPRPRPRPAAPERRQPDAGTGRAAADGAHARTTRPHHPLRRPRAADRRRQGTLDRRRRGYVP